MTTARQREQERKDKATVDAMVSQKVSDGLSLVRAFATPMANPYQGYAMLVRDLDELWHIIKLEREFENRGQFRLAMEKRAANLAVTAIQLITDCCGETVK
jgi:hypothetical protein